jgi:peptide/nickel transport system permease protein
MSTFWYQFRKDKAAVIGLVILILLIIIAILGPILIKTDPDRGDLQNRRAPPSIQHPLGLDQLGRDMLTRIVYGARYTLLAGFTATAFGALLGFLAGLISGFYGGQFDEFIMRSADLMLAFPFFLMAIVIISILGPGLTNAIIAVGIAKIPVFARFARGSALQVKEMEYMEAAQAIGCSNLRIMFKHLFPNIVMPAFVLATVEMARTVLTVSGLSFLGLGMQPPTPEWGLMLSEGRGYMTEAPHIIFFPGLSLFILVMAINLVGDGIQYATDPRTRGR